MQSRKTNIARAIRSQRKAPFCSIVRCSATPNHGSFGRETRARALEFHRVKTVQACARARAAIKLIDSRLIDTQNASARRLRAHTHTLAGIRHPGTIVVGRARRA